MSNEKIKTSFISDLLKIDRYRSHLENPDNLFLQDIYADQSLENLKRIHDIYTRYLLEYRNLGEPYPTVLETLENTNEQIESCVSGKKQLAN
jgi:uncharacterized protein YutD